MAKQAPRKAAPNNSDKPTKRLTVDIPEELHARLRIAAIRGRMNVAQAVQELLEKHLPPE